jgi:hypothetical protein
MSKLEFDKSKLEKFECFGRKEVYTILLNDVEVVSNNKLNESGVTKLSLEYKVGIDFVINLILKGLFRVIRETKKKSGGISMELIK